MDTFGLDLRVLLYYLVLQAGEFKWGTDEGGFINVLFQQNVTFAQLRATFDAYERVSYPPRFKVSHFDPCVLLFSVKSHSLEEIVIFWLMRCFLIRSSHKF